MTRKKTAHLIEALEQRRLLTVLTPGLTVQGTIASAAQVDTDTIAVTAGQSLVVALGESSTSAFDPQVQLRDPTGATVRTDSNEVGVIYRVTVAMSGNYSLRISDAGANDTGSYKLTVYTPSGNFSYGEEGAAGQSGRRRAANIGPGDLDLWTLAVTAGNFAAVTVTENTPGDPVTLGVMVFNPDGSLFADQTNAAGLSIDIPHNQSVTGSYTFVVYEPTAQVTGTYGISFACLPGPQYTGDPDTLTPLLNGVSRNGDLPGGDFDVFPVYIDETSTISATLSRGTGSLDPEVELFNPDGTQLATANGATTATAGGAATISGTYWLLCRDRESDDGGQYDLIYNLSIDNSQPAVKNNILTVQGTSKSDKITLSTTTHNGFAAIEVDENNKLKFYDAEEIQRIEIYAGAGDDHVIDNTSVNTYIFGDVGDDTLIGGSGRDTLTGAGGRNQLYGGLGDDRLNGSNGRDFLFGEAGNDRLYGNGGDDVLNGGGNVDRLFGGDGQDLLIGGAGNDKMFGEAGNDTLNGGAGVDSMDGGAGTDTRADHDLTDTIISLEA